jgi:molybdopterin/thiamine biosynthesis adenylyltransferase
VVKYKFMTSEFKRYERQMMLSGWGVETQERLKRASVLVVGAGGLGCPAALNLALAGVGHIRICDSDIVEINNLNRQFLHTEQSIGTNKAKSAQETLLSINSEVTVEPITHKIAEDNVDDIVGDAEVILDCLDNFTARRTLNLCAIRKGVPMVHGAIWGLEGRISFLHPPATPCLTCIFPKAPLQNHFPAVGAVSCAIGSLQALEAIKYLTNAGTLLSGRMLILDGSAMQCQELEVSKDPQCPACGKL